MAAEQSLEHYRQALTLQPQRLDWRCNLATLLADHGRHAEAIEQAGLALNLDPECFEALFTRGISLLALGDAKAAIEQFSRCVELRPREARAYNNLGLALAACRNFEGAISVYNQALALNPDYVRALNNRGLAELGRFCHQRALDDFDRALRLKPDYRAALINRGTALRALGQTETALESTRQAITEPEALANVADMLRELGRGSEAVEYSRQLWKRLPLRDNVAGTYHTTCQGIADWNDYRERIEAITAGVRAGRLPARPFAFLNASDSPADQLLCARSHARTLRTGPALWRGELYRHDRIRLAYLSSDFKTHATAYLMAGVFEHHDRQRFECFALSYGSCDPQDPMRARVRAAFEHFEDVGPLSIQQLASRIRELEIDVLVDLGGYTAGSRVETLAHRPAPIQAHYLGFPGTLGTSFVDYLIADRHVIPPHERIHYTESVVYLPHCYQPTDDLSTVSNSVWTRADAGLPPDSLVLCAFHQTYKLNPAVWDVWMRVLAHLPHSLLWLIARDPTVPANLRRAAAAHRIDPGRLVFAPHIARPEHLARLRLADLFLDTYPVGAHTTASDALWVGVPMVAIEGRGFAARVSASILRATGLSECIAASLPEYEALLMWLLTDRAALAAVRRRVESQVRQSPLFDTRGLTGALESAYRIMWERRQSGQALAPIELPAPDRG
jgi:protein O-GlcNAc transferase